MIDYALSLRPGLGSNWPRKRCGRVTGPLPDIDGLTYDGVGLSRHPIVAEALSRLGWAELEVCAAAEDLSECGSCGWPACPEHRVPCEGSDAEWVARQRRRGRIVRIEPGYVLADCDHILCLHCADRCRAADEPVLCAFCATGQPPCRRGTPPGRAWMGSASDSSGMTPPPLRGDDLWR